MPFCTSTSPFTTPARSELPHWFLAHSSPSVGSIRLFYAVLPSLQKASTPNCSTKVTSTTKSPRSSLQIIATDGYQQQHARQICTYINKAKTMDSLLQPTLSALENASEQTPSPESLATQPSPNIRRMPRKHIDGFPPRSDPLPISWKNIPRDQLIRYWPNHLWGNVLLHLDDQFLTARQIYKLMHPVAQSQLAEKDPSGYLRCWINEARSLRKAEQKGAPPVSDGLKFADVPHPPLKHPRPRHSRQRGVRFELEGTAARVSVSGHKPDQQGPTCADERQYFDENTGPGARITQRQQPKSYVSKGTQTAIPAPSPYMSSLFSTSKIPYNRPSRPLPQSTTFPTQTVKLDQAGQPSNTIQKRSQQNNTAAVVQNQHPPNAMNPECLTTRESTTDSSTVFSGIPQTAADNFEKGFFDSPWADWGPFMGAENSSGTGDLFDTDWEVFTGSAGADVSDFTS